jgi:hypothetical protein
VPTWPQLTSSGDTEVLVAERLKPGKHRVDLGLLLHKGRQGILVQPGFRLAGPGDHFPLLLLLSEPMNASSGDLIQKNIDPMELFFDLTCAAAYGWRAAF